MARAGERWSGQEIKRLRFLAEPGVMTINDLAAEMHRPRKAIKVKLDEMNLTAANSDGGKERKCSNWNSEERPCKSTFVGKYAGPCPRCRIIPSATAFELPARLL